MESRIFFVNVRQDFVYSCILNRNGLGINNDTNPGGMRGIYS